MSEIMIKKTRSAENFNTKSKLLGLTLDKKIELLNNMYSGKLHFHKTASFYSDTGDSDAIQIKILDDNIKIIELPEVEELDFEHLFSDICDTRKIVSIKFPKCMPKTLITDMAYLSVFERIWFWSDTVYGLDKLKDRYWSQNKMLILQHKDNTKSDVYRL